MFLQALEFNKADGFKRMASDQGHTKFAMLEGAPGNTVVNSMQGYAFKVAKYVII